MKLIDFIRLLYKHIVLLLAVPVLLATLVAALTRHPQQTYASQTVLFTGLATGSSIEMDKTFNYFLTNTAFDNLINIINARETQEEVAIRLLSQHLLLNNADPKFISKKSLADLKKITPEYVYKYVIKRHVDSTSIKTDKTVADSNNATHLFPANIDKDDYELTVRSLTNLMKSSDTNFVYKLLNFEDPHYSFKAISTVKVVRIANSDLIKLSYEVDDPGICQQTLALFNEACIKNYKVIKGNRSEDVVKYFETQLALVNEKLRSSEDKLLNFNKENNIINYNEQSKAVAITKEEVATDYNNKKAQLAGLYAAIKRLEEKLNIQQLVQLKSSSLLEKKKQLGDINYQIATVEALNASKANAIVDITPLKKQQEEIKKEIKKSIDELYTYQNTIDGLPISKVLNEWLNNVIESENLKAKLKVIEQQQKDLQQQYAIYAPAGANLKRIEREISVAEQGYLEILHELNQAKLKMQDNEMSSNLKTVDQPYYPLTPLPSKRKVLIIGAAFLGIIIILIGITMMEYFDDTLKNLKKASRILKLMPLGMLPKIYLKPGIEHFTTVQKRLFESITQNLLQHLETAAPLKTPQLITFLSTMQKEGKSVIAGNLAKHFMEQGKKVIYLNLSNDPTPLVTKKRFSLLHKLLGYQDPRIDDKHEFLKSVATYLPASCYFTSTIKDQIFKVNNYTDILREYDVTIDFMPEFIFIELPSLLKNNYPTCIINASDVLALTIRSNRIWTEADQACLKNILSIASEKVSYIINGVELKEVEAIVGELPKKRSLFRRGMKRLLGFNFLAKSQF